MADTRTRVGCAVMRDVIVGAHVLRTRPTGLTLRESTHVDTTEQVALPDRNRAHRASADAYEEESTGDRAWVGRHLADVPGDGSVRYGVRPYGVLIGRVDPVAAAPARRLRAARAAAQGWACAPGSALERQAARPVVRNRAGMRP
ncbi:hypothetical protein ACFU6I_12185 [Streptomyces sp. NPDC057486]|uniref:hypothetical protein n=1 Tax=Streptomyces sp. NPDC057486 TaxID=3346145 RepID=UPI0036C4FB31